MDGLAAGGQGRRRLAARARRSTQPYPSTESDIEVRDILVHIVEEYARHLGHADLLRECIDGRTGQ